MDRDFVILMAESEELTEIENSDNSLTIELSNKKECLGDGLIFAYAVFPGVFLQINDFRMKRAKVKYNAEGNYFSINHCRRGSLHSEELFSDRLEIGPGDVILSLTEAGKGHVDFDLGHYYGITLTFDLDLAMSGIHEYAPNLPVDIKKLVRDFDLKKDNLLLDNIRALDGIFDAMYAVPAHIRIEYFKVKVLEVLLCLFAIEIPDEEGEKPYFYKVQIEKVRKIHKMLTTNLDKHYNLKELSDRYNMSVPVMETCFQSLYGNSIAKYMREYRMSQAAILLRDSHDKSVLEIASEMGYNSPGKFSTAFKEIIGMSPLQYRKNFDRRLVKNMKKRTGQFDEEDK